MSVAKIIAPDVQELIRESPQELAAAVKDLHPADIAELLDELPREDRIVLFEVLPTEQGAAVLSELKGETLRLILHRASPQKLGAELDRLPADEVTFLLEHLTQRQREAILEKMSPRDADGAKRLLRYPPRTAGRLMSEKFARIRPEWTVAETLDHLKKIDPEVETVQSLYALDDSGHLVGYVSLRRLFPAPPLRKIADVMERRLLTVRADASQEEVARLVSKYDVHAIPVVDEENRLLGIVTVDDVIDILIEEQTEDVLHLGGVSATEETVEQGYFATKPFRNVRLRFNWLLLLFVAETFTGTVLRHFEGELAKVVALSFFIPLLIGTGGNSGSQTVTTIVRGLAVGDIRLRDFWRVFLREAGSGLLLGLMLGVVGVGRALLWGSAMPLALTVGISILAICTWANAVGATIPMFATAIKIDPTVMSAPLIATLVDATGLAIYFVIAKSILGL
ncbi:MAG TPA: magnesium transporter [Thermoanaerobaculia bacterium]|nr:magnesium transporter [Thermoanaerobaculia bacterium]